MWTKDKVFKKLLGYTLLKHVEQRKMGIATLEEGASTYDEKVNEILRLDPYRNLSKMKITQKITQLKTASFLANLVSRKLGATYVCSEASRYKHTYSVGPT